MRAINDSPAPAPAPAPLALALALGPCLTMERLCQFPALPLHPDLLRPYDDRRRRLTDGLRVESGMIGDPRFDTHRDIDPAVANR